MSGLRLNAVLLCLAKPSEASPSDPSSPLGVDLYRLRGSQVSYNQAPSITPRAPQAIYGRPPLINVAPPAPQPMAVQIASVPGMVSPTAYGRASLSNSPVLSPPQNGFGTPVTPTKFVRVGQLA